MAGPIIKLFVDIPRNGKQLSQKKRAKHKINRHLSHLGSLRTDCLADALQHFFPHLGINIDLALLTMRFGQFGHLHVLQADNEVLGAAAPA